MNNRISQGYDAYMDKLVDEFYDEQPQVECRCCDEPFWPAYPWDDCCPRCVAEKEFDRAFVGPMIPVDVYLERNK